MTESLIHHVSHSLKFKLLSCTRCLNGARFGSPAVYRVVGPIVRVSYPSVEWLERFASAPSSIINRAVGKYHLFAVGVRSEHEGALHYCGSVNVVPRNRFSTEDKAAIFNFDQEFFETADAAANHAIDRVISIISTWR
jgi:hypothetical protein